VTARASSIGTQLRRSVDPQPLLLGLGVLAACLLTARLLTEPRDLRLAVVGTALVLIVGLSAVSPVRLLFGLVVWLTALGFLRRTLNVISPTPHADLLLLVGPVAFAVLFIAAAKRGAFHDRSRLASAVLVLNVLMVVGALNPLQGSLSTGFAGLLFVLVPTLAFWVGRGLCDDRSIAIVLKLFAVLSLLAAAYGFMQTFAGFPSWDAAWIEVHRTDYLALAIHGIPRAFASFSAPAEYVTFLAIGLIVWATFGLTPVLAPVAMGAIAVLGVAIFYEGSRGVVVSTLVALSVMVGARAGVRLKWSVGLAAILILLLPYVVGHFVTANSAGYSSPFVARQVQGLQNPTDPASSSLRSHINLVRQGIHSARLEPVGKGSGAVTLAGLKFGGGDSSTEADPSNAAVAWGLPGLLVYLLILIEALRRGYRFASLRRDWMAAAAIAIIVVTVPQWLNGGLYAVAFLPWLLLGWIDRSLMNRSAPVRELD
jgi:hypothetical protein